MCRLSLILLFSCTAFVNAADIFVSPSGSDTNIGGGDTPVKTLSRALTLAREIEEPVTIWMAGGVYHPNETIRLTAEDSRPINQPLTIRAQAGQEVIIAGGAEIPATRFKKMRVQLERLAKQARGKVWVASLKGTNLGDYFPYQPDYREGKGNGYGMLAWDGYLLQQAQWPNRGYAYIEKTLEEGATNRWLKPGETETPYSFAKPSGGVFQVYPDLDFAALKREFDRTQDMWVQGYLAADWFFEKIPLGAVDDQAKTLQLLRHTRYGVDFKQKGLPRRFQVINALCQLDEPGEWYYDHQDQLLYLWPVQAITAEKPVSVVGGPTLIAAKDVKHVTIRDIIFENFGSVGVQFLSCQHIVVGGCTFRNGRDLGLEINDGMHNTITGCNFYDLDRAFLLLGQAPDPSVFEDTIRFEDSNADFLKKGYSENRRNLVAEYNVAHNNHIHHCRLRGYGTVEIGGVGATFSHNLVHSMNGGIIYGHNDLLMEYNEFYDVGYEMGDWNICYCGADKASYNNRIRFNFFHHLYETPRAYPVIAIRADDGATGLHLFGNLFYKSGRGCFTFRSPNNSAQNNVALKTNKLWYTVQFPYHVKPREEELQELWEKYWTMQQEIAAGEYSVHQKENYIGRVELVLGKQGWLTNQRWREHYPDYAKVFMNFRDPNSNPWIQAYCYVRKNYHDKVTKESITMHGRHKLDTFEDKLTLIPDTSVVEEPHAFNPTAMFVNPEDMDFRMRDDFDFIPGFEKIPFERIGLVQDEYRTTVLDKQAYRLAVKQKYQGKRASGGAFDRDKVNEIYTAPAYLTNGR